ncbi:MAG: FtsX-like permease family protein [Coriobacteriia bacterium]|nr:FtsX-like permease family protein [Coriobacteriia bacterium]
MARIFNISVGRSIRESLGRFLAILLIVALGCGFYAGLRMTGPDMRTAADAWYDGTHLYDVEVLSTLGLSQQQVDEIAAAPGVEAVMPAKSVDVMTELNDSQYVMRVHSLDIDAAQKSEAVADNTVQSDDDRYLNRLVLDSGKWPEHAGEAILSADRVMNTTVSLGDTVIVEYGSTDLKDVLKEREYTVVGLAHSSLYTSDANMGTTSLGSGKIQQYMYVADDNFDADMPFTEVYLRVAGADAELAGSDAYQERVDEVTKRLESLAPDVAANRLDELRSDAQAELDDAKAEYEDAQAETDEKLADARKELEDGQAEIDKNQAKLDDAAAKIADGKKKLKAGEKQLAEKESELADGKKKWKKQRADLEAAIRKAQAGKAEAEAKLPEVQAARDEAEQGLAQVKEGIAAIEGKLAELSAQRAQAETGLAAAQAAEKAARDAGDEAAAQAAAAQVAAAEQAIAAIDAGITALEGTDSATAMDPNLAQLNALKQQAEEGLQQAEAGLKQITDGVNQANEGISQAQAGIEAGDATIADAERQLAAGKEELAASRKKLKKAQAEYDDGAAQLADAREELADGWAEYEKERKKAERKLADARDEIANAQDDIDALEPPDIYVLDRTKNFGVQSVQADSERIDNIASVFPFVFFLVAALVALTTMTRMVDEERQLIGTFKALGYSKRRITGKYLFYAGAASTAGAALGIAVLGQVLPGIIQNAYAIIYNVPQPEGLLAYDPFLTLLAGLLGIGITLVATWGAAARTLRETPAALMLPPAPEPGKRILLEHLGAIWRRLSFSWKVTCRNLFRYKKRFWMTVIGLAGCTALLLTGFGLHNAIWDIIDKQYGPIVCYNVHVDMEEEATAADVDAVVEILETEGKASAVARAHTVNLQVGTGGIQDETRGVLTVVPRNAADFGQIVNMKVRETQEPVPFDGKSVVMTEKLSRLLGVGVGDEVALFEQDSIGNATGTPSKVRITGIVEFYVSDALFLGKDAYRQAMGGATKWNAVFANTDTSVRDSLNDALMAGKNVQTVAFNDETIDTYRTMLQSVNIIVVVLVAAAALLSFIVLYNLININITERRREIASLKVLGFTPREVNSYIFREVLLLTLIGAAIGLVLGVFLEGFVVSTAEVDYVMFGREIHAWSFVAAFALTIVFTWVVMLFMHAKLAAIDMVESLKSVE